MNLEPVLIQFLLCWARLKKGLSRPAFQLVYLVLLLAASALYGCSGREPITEQHFAGKWKSSKLTTPIYLYANGEWEIKSEDGAILQFGVWQYADRKIIWSYKVDSHIGHDVNALVSATPGEFRIRESDNSITTFTKLE